MSKKIKSIITFLSMACLAVYIKTALAIGTDPINRLDGSGSGAGYNVYNKPTIQSVIVVIINYVLGFMGIILISLVLFAGFQWMTSGGNEEKITKAKKTLQNSVIGLMIVVMAWAITWFVANYLIKSTTPGYYSFP